jgi:hypothetical protein
LGFRISDSGFFNHRDDKFNPQSATGNLKLLQSQHVLHGVKAGLLSGNPQRRAQRTVGDPSGKSPTIFTTTKIYGESPELKATASITTIALPIHAVLTKRTKTPQLYAKIFSTPAHPTCHKDQDFF